MDTHASMHTYYRSGSAAEGTYEKPVIVPKQDDNDPKHHVWADARFATDIMAEHGLFFALLIPEELAAKEKRAALDFYETFSDLNKKIDGMSSFDDVEMTSFVSDVIDPMRRFIEYKHEQHEAQLSGSLRSLVWPLFFEHTFHEAERWVRRLEKIAGGSSGFERGEVVPFWTNIMDEHARFVAHLLDPDEFELIDTAMKTSRVFGELNKGGLGGVASAIVKEPGTVVKSLAKNPEVDAVMSAAETVLDFKTKAARNIETARIKSIIDQRLADHVRREALKFVDELKRAE